MKMNALVDDDERAIAIENQSYRLGFSILSFGLLLDLSVRDLIWRNPASYWDLIALFMIANIICIAYQVYHRILHREWMQRMGVFAIRLVLMFVLMVLCMKFLR